MIIKKFVSVFILVLLSQGLLAQAPKLTPEIAVKLSKMPLGCIVQEFPNKTSHVANTAVDGRLLPSELHPAFYGCLDWHSAVHGHWMLVRLLKTIPGLTNEREIIDQLNKTFSPEKMQAEANYFTKYEVANTYERTYGWAWLLKLDQELYTWDNPNAKRWHQALQPLTAQILKLWKAYLPKQTYPNRTGVHPNTAFGLVFALDWASTMKDTSFEEQIKEKAKAFYLDNAKTPAYLEPDGSDFFSPSLEIADLMRRVLLNADFVHWFNRFYEKNSIDRISDLPVISDINDYQGVHLVGLSFTRAWCMKGIAKDLPASHKLKKHFELTADKFLSNALPLVFAGNYGGDHWLASFAVYALEK
ncbi:DUF2891 domain-containing protein [Pedobacter sandarakinus]|uniref:DUF2891 domain-containing protein n=1 Tax=Pedobacter sandarakinus TaxID=353156 RepID=UPI00224851E9|nr:DUF2891 domain-containing protein [Pedobacter sandarakinus]MCX2573027.1 DUF2891 domain-containing protein [Pedobacter sandarakinus]